MANKILWDATYTSRGNVLTTELNALATSNACALGAEFDNTTNLEQYFVAVFTSGGSLTPGAGSPYLALYAIPTADGTNYATNYVTGASEILPAEHLACVFSLPASTAANPTRCVSRIFTLGPGKYKFILYSEAGASLPATTNTVALFSCADEVQ